MSRLKTRAFFGISSPPENCLYYPCFTFGVQSKGLSSQVNCCCIAQSARVSQLMAIRQPGISLDLTHSPSRPAMTALCAQQTADAGR
jgi:hypothetical protein